MVRIERQKLFQEILNEEFGTNITVCDCNAGLEMYYLNAVDYLADIDEWFMINDEPEVYVPSEEKFVVYRHIYEYEETR